MRLRSDNVLELDGDERPIDEERPPTSQTVPGTFYAHSSGPRPSVEGMSEAQRDYFAARDGQQRAAAMDEAMRIDLQATARQQQPWASSPAPVAEMIRVAWEEQTKAARAHQAREDAHRQLPSVSQREVDAAARAIVAAEGRVAAALAKLGAPRDTHARAASSARDAAAKVDAMLAERARLLAEEAEAIRLGGPLPDPAAPARVDAEIRQGRLVAEHLRGEAQRLAAVLAAAEAEVPPLRNAVDAARAAHAEAVFHCLLRPLVVGFVADMAEALRSPVSGEVLRNARRRVAIALKPLLEP